MDSFRREDSRLFGAPGSGGVSLRIDERAGRLFIQPASEDRYFASGWELRSEQAFAEALAELAGLGIAFTRSTNAERALRHVTDMVWFLDPAGNRHELSYGYVPNFAKFCSPTGTRLVTGDLG